MGGMCLWLTRCVSYSLHLPRRSGSLRQLAQKTGSNRRSPSLLGCSSLRKPRYGLPQAHPAHTLLPSFGVETSKKLGLPCGNPFFYSLFSSDISSASSLCNISSSFPRSWTFLKLKIPDFTSLSFL